MAWISRLKPGRLEFCAYRALTAVATLRIGRYYADSIGGKGGTRTLDPGIMRPNRRIGLSPLSGRYLIAGTSFYYGSAGRDGVAGIWAPKSTVGHGRITRNSRALVQPGEVFLGTCSKTLRLFVKRATSATDRSSGSAGCAMLTRRIGTRRCSAVPAVNGQGWTLISDHRHGESARH